MVVAAIHILINRRRRVDQYGVVTTIGNQKHSKCISSVHCSRLAHLGIYPTAPRVYISMVYYAPTLITFTTV